MVESSYQYGMWSMVLFNIVLFGGFALSFIRPKTRVEWRRMGLFTGFLVALFVEMYGIPLTVYILVSTLGWVPASGAFQHVNGHILGTLLGLPPTGKYLICMVGGMLVFGGLVLMGKAWKRIHEADGDLVTGGLYGKVRHPQYSGLLLIIIGFLVQWPTLITLAMAPMLVGAYIHLAFREERALRKEFGEEFERYRNRVPAFVPYFTHQ